MNIIFASRADAENLATKYTVLELDTLWRPGQEQPDTAWCLLDQVALPDLSTLAQYRDLHNNMMRNYQLRNWKYCQDALEHLIGRWQGELDSFYKNMSARVTKYQQTEPEADWSSLLDSAT